MNIGSSTDSVFSLQNLCHSLSATIAQDQQSATNANQADQELEAETNEGSANG